MCSKMSTFRVERTCHMILKHLLDEGLVIIVLQTLASTSPCFHTCPFIKDDYAHCYDAPILGFCWIWLMISLIQYQILERLKSGPHGMVA